MISMCAGTLQIFNGTLTEIACTRSAAVPVYRLVEQGIVYDSYAELPDLFDIEARSSPTGNSVTLYINGTNRSNNVTVTCGYIDISVGISFNVLFTLILEFVSKFINQTSRVYQTTPSPLRSGCIASPVQGCNSYIGLHPELGRKWSGIYMRLQGHTYLIFCCAGGNSLQVRSVGRLINKNDSHVTSGFHGNHGSQKLFTCFL